MGRVVAGPHGAVLENFTDSTDINAICVDALVPPSKPGASDQNAQRWLIQFEPSPSILVDGVDMDDLLSYRSYAYRSLRQWESLSFLKLDCDEAAAVREAVLLANYSYAKSGQQPQLEALSTESVAHRLAQLGAPIPASPSSRPIISHWRNGRGLGAESALEASVLMDLATPNSSSMKAFGKWDWLYRQVPASPPKPSKYASRMDILCSRAYSDAHRFPASYLVIELKKGSAELRDVDQVMRYVDWIAREYCGGNYSRVDAAIVARAVDAKVLSYAGECGQRTYTLGSQRSQTTKWTSIALYGYEVAADNESLQFTRS